MQEEFKYNFKCGLKATLSELSVKQNHQLIAYVSKLSKADLGVLLTGDLNSASLNDIITAVGIEEPVQSILVIILRDETGKPFPDKSVFDEIKESELKQVYDDFLLLKPAVLQLLTNLKENAGSEMMNTMLSNINTTHPLNAPIIFSKPLSQPSQASATEISQNGNP